MPQGIIAEITSLLHELQPIWIKSEREDLSKILVLEPILKYTREVVKNEKEYLLHLYKHINRMETDLLFYTKILGLDEITYPAENMDRITAKEKFLNEHLNHVLKIRDERTAQIAAMKKSIATLIMEMGIEIRKERANLSQENLSNPSFSTLSALGEDSLEPSETGIFKEHFDCFDRIMMQFSYAPRGAEHAAFAKPMLTDASICVSAADIQDAGQRLSLKLTAPEPFPEMTTHDMAAMDRNLEGCINKLSEPIQDPYPGDASDLMYDEEDENGSEIEEKTVLSGESSALQAHSQEYANGPASSPSTKTINSALNTSKITRASRTPHTLHPRKKMKSQSTMVAGASSDLTIHLGSGFSGHTSSNASDPANSYLPVEEDHADLNEISMIQNLELSSPHLLQQTDANSKTSATSIPQDHFFNEFKSVQSENLYHARVNENPNHQQHNQSPNLNQMMMKNFGDHDHHQQLDYHGDSKHSINLEDMELINIEDEEFSSEYIEKLDYLYKELVQIRDNRLFTINEICTKTIAYQLTLLVSYRENEAPFSSTREGIEREVCHHKPTLENKQFHLNKLAVLTNIYLKRLSYIRELRAKVIAMCTSLNETLPALILKYNHIDGEPMKNQVSMENKQPISQHANGEIFEGVTAMHIMNLESLVENLKKTELEKIHELVDRERKELVQIWDRLSFPAAQREIFYQYFDKDSIYSLDFLAIMREELAKKKKQLEYMGGIIKLIEKRTAFYTKMLDFEKTASDPRRFFQNSKFLLQEEKFRNTAYPNLCKMEAALLEELQLFQDKFEEPFNYQGVDYLAYLKEEIATRSFSESVFGIKGMVNAAYSTHNLQHFSQTHLNKTPQTPRKLAVPPSSSATSSRAAPAAPAIPAIPVTPTIQNSINSMHYPRKENTTPNIRRSIFGGPSATPSTPGASARKSIGSLSSFRGLAPSTTTPKKQVTPAPYSTNSLEIPGSEEKRSSAFNSTPKSKSTTDIFHLK